MAPKKVVKSKKEDVVEIPKSDLLPDGFVTHFIGGWSSCQSLSALTSISKAKNTGDKVVILPGTIVDGEISVELRSLTVEGGQAPRVSLAPVADDADSPVEPSTTVADPLVDQSVTVEASLTLLAWVPPAEIKAPTPPPAEEPKKDAKAPKGKDTKKKVAVVEEEAAPPPPVEEETPKGANPASWPTVTFKRLCFRGPIICRGVHTVFDECHFIGGHTHQIQIHQYCIARFNRCTFSLPSRACVYGYPTSRVEASDCTFHGGDLAALQEKRESQTSNGTQSVGIHGDDAEIVVKECRFSRLSIGALLHDKCANAAITKSSFEGITNTGCYVDGASSLLRGNTIKDCAYYAINIQPRSKPKVFQNSFMAKVRVCKGAAPVLHGNSCAFPVEDLNVEGNVYMQPSY